MREEPASTVVEGGEHLVTRLLAGGPEGDAAARELHDLLVRAALAHLVRQGYSLEAFGADDPEALAEDFAQEALATILRQLHTFRGQSRFTTWAYRIVINLISDEFRRRAWRRRPLPAEHESLPLRSSPADDPVAEAERDEVWAVIAKVIQEELTPRQRQVLVGRFFQDKPLVGLAEELNTSKDAVYKLLHDARKRLKRALLAHGFTEAEALAAFERR